MDIKGSLPDSLTTVSANSPTTLLKRKEVYQNYLSSRTRMIYVSNKTYIIQLFNPKRVGKDRYLIDL